MEEEKNQKKGLVIRAWASIKKIVCENKKTVIALAICLLVIFGSAFAYWRPHYLAEGETVLIGDNKVSPDYWQRYGFDQIKLVYKENGKTQYIILHKDLFGGEVEK